MNRLFLTAGIAAVCLLESSSAHAAQSFTFQNGVAAYSGTFDTQIRGATPDRADGNLQQLNPDGSDGDRPVQALIKFGNIFGTELGRIPPGSSILFASLTVYVVNAGNAPALHRMLTDWDETTTWNSIKNPNGTGIRPGIEAALEPDAVFDASGQIPFYREIILPAATLQDWLDGKTPNYGWAFIPSGTDGVDFPSSEHSTVEFRPRLTIVTGVDGEPLVLDFISSPSGFQFELRDGLFLNGKANPIRLSTIRLMVDGQAVTPLITQENDSVTVSYSPSGFFPSGSTHTVSLEFKDSAATPILHSIEQTFGIGEFLTLPSWAAVTGVDTSTSGFTARVSQIGGRRAPGDQNSTENAERQLANEIIDPATNQPYVNLADNFLARENGRFGVVNWINWEEAGNAAGNFRENTDPPRPDDLAPGIPGILGESDNFVVEILTFLELKQGFHQLGVNSDEGFKLTAGINPMGALAFRLGEFSGSRSFSDTVVEFAVAEDGFYPFRLIWWDGSGGASLEFFSIDPITGAKTLVNDRDHPNGIRAFRAGPEAPPYALSVAPEPGQTDVSPKAGIQIVLQDTTRQVQTGSVKLFVNGESATPHVSKSGGRTTVGYNPPNGLPRGVSSTVRVEFSDGSTPPSVTAEEFSFRTATSAPVIFTFQEGLNGYTGTHDTAIREGAPTQENGSSKSLSIDGLDGSAGGGENHILMRFGNLSGVGPTQIPPGSIVKSASLTLRFSDPGDDPSLHRMLKPWQESETWATFDPVSRNGVTANDNEASARRDGIMEGGNPVPVFSTVDLPVQTIQDWLDGRLPNHGWVFIPGGTNGADFDTSEADVLGNRPLLTIVIEDVVEPPPIAQPLIGIGWSASGIRITFDGILQSADSITGPYTDMSEASSPAVIPTVGSAKFYRTRR